MKIIKNPGDDIRANFKEQVTCDTCKSLLEIEWSDVKFQPASWDGRNGSDPEYFYCKCPVCKPELHLQVVIPNELIPSHFKHYIIKEK